MHKKLSLFFPILFILVISLACSIPSGAPSATEDISKQVATAAAGTLTAIAPTAAAPDVPDEPPAPTDTPTEVPATATPEPVGAAELRLVYNDTNGHLWTWTEGGSPLQIVGTGDVNEVKLSSDGEWIAFTRQVRSGSGASLWAIRFNGSGEHQLISREEFNAMPLSEGTDPTYILSNQLWEMEFVPGTYTLAFNTYPQFEGPGLANNEDLWLVDVESETRTALLEPGQGGHFFLSPDGSQIALTTPTSISLINLDGSNRRDNLLTYPFVYTYSEYAYYAKPVWSPDSSFLRVVIPPQDSLGDPTALGNIYQIPTDGSPAFLLGNLTLAPLQGGFLSPNLETIAHMTQVGDPIDNTWSINFANYDGSGSAEFTNGNITFLSWAPDSSHFAYEVRSPRAIHLGQTGVTGSTLVDVNPSAYLTWINAERYFFYYQISPEWQLRLGSIGSPSTIIGNLGSGPIFSTYDFVSP